MPLYEYCCNNEKCEKSEKILSYMVPLARHDEKIPCPKCRKTLRKLLAAPYFNVK